MKVKAKLVKSAAGSEAKGAFKHELQHFLSQKLLKAIAEMDKEILGIEKGKWPQKRMEYGVMRYKPMSMTDEDFKSQLLDAYQEWVRPIQKVVG